MKNNKIIYPILSIFVGLFISSCNISMPTSNVVTEEKRPSIIFSDKKSKALIYVDGIKMGEVRNYSKKSLLLESGSHSLKIIENGEIILKKKIFITGEEIRKINLK